MTHGLGPSVQLQSVAGRGKQQQKTRFHRTHPVVRLCLAVLFAVFLLTLSHLASLTLCFLLSIVMAFWARLPLLASLKRAVLMESFLIFTVILLPFTQPGTEIASLFGLSISEEGCYLALRLLLIANSSTLMLLSLVGTIEPALIGRVLGSLYCPARFVFLIDFSVRYIGLLHDEYLRGREAMRARAFQLLDMRQARNWQIWRRDVRQAHFHRYQSIGYLFAMGLVRAIERAQMIHDAMRCRGYQDINQYRYPIQLKIWDMIFAGCFISCLVAIGGVDYL